MAVVSIASATVTVNDWPAIQDVNFNASLANGLLSIDTLHAAWLEATLDATGSSPLRALSPWLPGWVIDAQPATNAPASLSAKFDNVTRAVIAPFTGPDALEDIAGEISGTLTLEAPQITLDELTGELVLDQVDIVLSQVPVAQVAPTRLTLAKRTVTVDNWRWTGAGSEFEVTGGARIDRNNELRLDAAVDTTVDLKLLGAFSRAVSTGGQAIVSLTLSGPAADPNIDGSITINDAALRVRDPRIAVVQRQCVGAGHARGTADRPIRRIRQWRSDLRRRRHRLRRRAAVGRRSLGMVAGTGARISARPAHRGRGDA